MAETVYVCVSARQGAKVHQRHVWTEYDPSCGHVVAKSPSGVFGHKWYLTFVHTVHVSVKKINLLLLPDHDPASSAEKQLFLQSYV